jgi:hypothetical protein
MKYLCEKAGNVLRKIVELMILFLLNQIEKIVYRKKIPITDPSLVELARSSSSMAGREFSVTKRALAHELIKSKELNELLSGKKKV